MNKAYHSVGKRVRVAEEVSLIALLSRLQSKVPGTTPPCSPSTPVFVAHRIKHHAMQNNKRSATCTWTLSYTNALLRAHAAFVSFPYHAANGTKRNSVAAFSSSGQSTAEADGSASIAGPFFDSQIKEWCKAQCKVGTSRSSGHCRMAGTGMITKVVQGRLKLQPPTHYEEPGGRVRTCVFKVLVPLLQDKATTCLVNHLFHLDQRATTAFERIPGDRPRIGVAVGRRAPGSAVSANRRLHRPAQDWRHT